MDDYRDAIVSCCKQLRLSANLADNAFAIQGESHQEYLYNLLSEEIKCRKAARVGKLINSAGFPVQHNFASFHPDEVQFPSGVTPESLKALEFFRAGNNLVMYGSTGTGKTMLSICIGMEACRKGIPREVLPDSLTHQPAFRGAGERVPRTTSQEAGQGGYPHSG